jgi:diacylglycerol kinase (ATP)
MKVILLYNPNAGRGKIEYDLEGITAYMASLNIEFETKASTQVGDLKHFAETMDEEVDVVMVAGGDGSISEVVSGLMTKNKKPSLLPLPYGSANDIAHILGIPKFYEKAIDLMITQSPVLMDINQINDHYFVYTTAVGLFTRISYDIKRSLLKTYGPLAYYVEGLKDITKQQSFKTVIQANNKTYESESALILGLAANRVGGIPLLNIQSSKLNDGHLELRLFEGQKVSAVLRILMFFARFGKSYKAQSVIISNAFQIKVPSHMKWNADGELVTTGSVNIRVLKEALPVIASKKAIKRHF